MIDLAAQLARDGVDPLRMGQAYARRAHPNLDAWTPLGAYGVGFIDGAAAAFALLAPLQAGVVDVAEAIARLCDPDALPLPDVPPPPEPAEA